jgi:diguanylate cyclase (GGDEF)-like protein
MRTSAATAQLRSQHFRVFLVTGLFVFVGALLAVLVAIAVAAMTKSANEIDDARAIHAGQAAVEALKTQLSATVRDNAIWDDAYQQISTENGAAWAIENWGETTANYPLYDISVVISPSGKPLIAYRKGEVFEPASYFDASFPSVLAAAQLSGKNPEVHFIKTAEGISVIGAAAIQPYTGTAEEGKGLFTLIFAKSLTPVAIGEIARSFGLDGLALNPKASHQLLSFGLKDIGMQDIGFLNWPSKAPGTLSYVTVRPYLIASGTILMAFLLAILIVGFAVVQNLQHAASSARYKATHDALSGLLNRAGLLEILQSRLATVRQPDEQVRLYLIDLDGFKDVNDAWGHAVGDELIKLVAACLSKFSHSGSIVARLGGDEFAIAQIEPWDGTLLSQDVLSMLAAPFEIGGRTIEIGASIGIASVGNEAVTALELMRRADIALYSAKESGRGRAVSFAPELDVDRQLLSELEEKLRNAIADKQITVAFQPLFDAQSGELRGVEALARWLQPTGSVSPDVFIPLAERSGLIDVLGFDVLSVAIDHAKQWPNLGLSVNVSPVQLRNPHFSGDVAALLRSKEFEPARLTLEITEGVLMSNPEQAKRSIDALKDVGIKFALDDFGCGYASIGALRQFGFDRMKIDRSLVTALDGEDPVGAVLKATISLATALNIPVTAEGIETERQAETLRRSGCDQLQGFLLGKPMKADELDVVFFASPKMRYTAGRA